MMVPLTVFQTSSTCLFALQVVSKIHPVATVCSFITFYNINAIDFCIDLKIKPSHLAKTLHL